MGPVVKIQLGKTRLVMVTKEEINKSGDHIRNENEEIKIIKIIPPKEETEN